MENQINLQMQIKAVSNIYHWPTAKMCVVSVNLQILFIISQQ